jgi:DNA-3-methyladenine glycosylase
VKKSIGKLPKSFYIQGAVKLARNLIGKLINRKIGEVMLSGIIVEAEAYTGANDPASHAYVGRTKRNEVMFGEGGKAYVYFTYGNHYCFNVVAGSEGKAGAVLIRAVEPIQGIETMKIKRNTNDLYNLTNGPGKFAKAFGIDKSLYGSDLSGDVIFITEPGEDRKFKVLSSKRIGIKKNTEKLYRFFMKDNPFVSGSRKINNRAYDKSK